MQPRHKRLKRAGSLQTAGCKYWQYGYPPDMQKLATETVLEQAKLIAEELTRKG